MKTTIDSTVSVYQIIINETSYFCNMVDITRVCKEAGAKSAAEVKILRIWNHKFEPIKGELFHKLTAAL